MSTYIIGGDDRDSFLEWLSNSPELALDIETVEDIIIGIGLGTDEKRGYFTGRDAKVLLPYIVDIQAKNPIVMHNGKSDVLGLRKSFPGFPMIRIQDTMVEAHLAGYEDLDLKAVTQSVLGEDIEKFTDLVGRYKTKDLEGVPEEVVAEYNLSQVSATWRIDRALIPNLDPDIYGLEMDILPILSQMEENGFLIDRERLLELREQYVNEAAAWTEAVKTLTGGEIQNVNSPKQVREFLYGFLGHKVIYETKSKAPSTAERVLKKIVAGQEGSLPEYRWIRPLLHARQTIKLIGTYCDGIVDKLDAEGRSHTSLSQVSTDTGRLASRDPNHQNIPKRRGPEIRRCFIAPPGHYIVAADMDQLELRIIAEESGEETMRQVFLSGGDIHQQTADEVLGDSTKRFPAKVLNYTIGYLAGAQQIADQLGVSRHKAERLQDTYFRKYYRLTRWINEWDALCRARGYTETWLGRRRDVSQFYNDPKKNYQGGSFKVGTGGRSHWGEGTRKALNTRIQGTAAEIMKFNMLKVENELRALGLGSRQLIQVHDEIVLEVPEEELDIVKNVLRRKMSTLYKEMPLPCTVKVGRNWGDVK